MSDLHVCLVTGEFPPTVGGIADYTALLAEHLREQGARVSVVTSDHRSGDRRPDVSTVQGWGFRSMPEIARRIGNIEPDVVHLQYQTAAFEMSPAVCLLPYAVRAPSRQTRFITTFHDLRVPYLFPKAGLLRRAPARLLLGASDGAIFTDQSDLLAARPRRRATWIPIGPGVVPRGRRNRTAARARFRIAPDAFVIAHFGFINASKGVETLLAAAERLRRTGLRFHVLFIGDDQGVSDPTNTATAARMRFLESRFRIEDHIIRTGWLPATELSRAFAASDVAALPYADGASLRRSSLLTCFAHGLPVVTTTPVPFTPVPRESAIEPFDEPERFRIDESLAALVPAGDDGALASTLHELARDAGRRKALARSGRQFAQRLSWRSIARGTAGFYNVVVGTGA